MCVCMRVCMCEFLMSLYSKMMIMVVMMMVVVVVIITTTVIVATVIVVVVVMTSLWNCQISFEVMFFCAYRSLK